MNMSRMSMTPQALQDLLDELEASRASRKRSWEILQEIRWVLKDTAGIEAQQPARKTIDLEGRVVKDAVRKTLKDRQNALTPAAASCSRISRIRGPTAYLTRLG